MVKKAPTGCVCWARGLRYPAEHYSVPCRTLPGILPGVLLGAISIILLGYYLRYYYLVTRRYPWITRRYFEDPYRLISCLQVFFYILQEVCILSYYYTYILFIFVYRITCIVVYLSLLVSSQISYIFIIIIVGFVVPDYLLILWNTWDLLRALGSQGGGSFT